MTALACFNTCAVDEDGSLYAWGMGGSSELWLNSRQHQLLPMRFGEPQMNLLEPRASPRSLLAARVITKWLWQRTTSQSGPAAAAAAASWGQSRSWPAAAFTQWR